MTIKYLDSKRLEGVAGDLTTKTLTSGTGGWVEVGRTTLGSAGDNITVSSLANKRYYMILHDVIPSGSVWTQNTFNDDTTGGNTANRRSVDGATDALQTSANYIYTSASQTTPMFGVYNIANLAGKEKLQIYHNVMGNTAGAGTAPRRYEASGKWSNTTDSISTFNLNNGGSGDFASGSEVVVLGWDESDTNNTNFWQELGTTELTTAGDNIEVTFTAKKYLMVKFYRKQTGAADARWTFNNDGGTSYASRTSAGGGSDSTAINQNYFTQNTYDNNAPSYSSTMIVNTAGQEKLATQHEMTPLGTGAGNSPYRSESVFKWANTSDQITTIDITNSKSGSYDVGSIIEVWGHD